jgi:hypothetical protein
MKEEKRKYELVSHTHFISLFSKQNKNKNRINSLIISSILLQPKKLIKIYILKFLIPLLFLLPHFPPLLSPLLPSLFSLLTPSPAPAFTLHATTLHTLLYTHYMFPHHSNTSTKVLCIMYYTKTR